MARIRKYVWRFLGLATLTSAIYIAAAKFGLTLALVNPSATAIWPPTGIAIAALLIWGYDLWPAVFVGAFFANLTTAGSTYSALGIATGNTAEALVAAYLVKTYAHGLHAFERPRNVILFTIFAGIVSTAASATIGTLTLLLNGLTPQATVPSVWFTWWLGDMGGALVITPFIVLWWNNHRFSFRRDTAIELALCIAALLLTNYLIFTNVLPFPYFAVPVLLWVAYRFGPRETSTAIVVLSIFAIRATLQGYGPFILESGANINRSLLFLQSFMAIMSVTKLTVASLVADQRHAEDLLHIRERHFRALIEKSSDAVALIDETVKILYVSPSITRILGYSPDELVGQNGLSFIHPDDKKLIIQNLEELRDMPGGTNVSEARILRKDGDWAWGEFIGTNLIHDQAVKAYVINFRDITERRALDVAKTEFLMIAAHQLRSPLAAMRWSMELLLKDTVKLPKALKDKLKQLYESNQKMIYMVNELLDVSRIIQGDIPNSPEMLSVEEVLEKEIAVQQSTASKLAISIRVVPPKKKLPQLYLDPKRITAVVQNLLSNAIKYSDPNQTVTIKLWTDQKDLHMTVEDEGIGIPKNEQDKLFTKFYRASNAVVRNAEGTGLGLFVVRSFLVGWGGTIEIQSPTKDGGRGTTAHITIPLLLSKKKEERV